MADDAQKELDELDPVQVERVARAIATAEMPHRSPDEEWPHELHRLRQPRWKWHVPGAEAAMREFIAIQQEAVGAILKQE